ncbi:MAG: hypothetical protein R3B84_02105 [Zavarzinella sp.]
MDIKWDDHDPVSGDRRWIKADHFAGKWLFYLRVTRRSQWMLIDNPELDLWDTLLEALSRRYPRQEVDMPAIQLVKKQISLLKSRPTAKDV